MFKYFILISFLAFFGIIMLIVVAHTSAKIKQKPNKLSGICIINKNLTPSVNDPNPKPVNENVWYCDYCGQENNIHQQKCNNCKANRN